MTSPWILDMVWRDVCFAHWSVPGAALEQMLPAGVDLDRFEDAAWLSVVPFRMTAVHTRWSPVLPGFGDVAEINLRTYVRVGQERGIWFFSLDASGPLLVRSARIATGLPYFDARIETHEHAGTIAYASRRAQRNVAAGAFAATYAAPGDAGPVAPGSLDAFLHERYRFFALRGTRLVAGTVRHRPWKLATANIAITQNSLGDLIGMPLVGPPQRACFARELHVRATAVGRATRP